MTSIVYFNWCWLVCFHSAMSLTDKVVATFILIVWLSCSTFPKSMFLWYLVDLASDLWFLLPLNTSEHNYNAVTNWITIWQVNMKPADIVGHHRSGSFGVSTYPPRFRPTFSSRQFLSVRYQSENKYIGSNTFPPWKKMGTSVLHAPAPLHHCIVTKATKDTGEHD